MAASTTNWRISPVAWVPIGIAIIAEATSNALRAYALGTHLEAFNLDAYDYKVSAAGSMLVMAAVAVSLSQARAAWVALLPGMARQRIVAGVIAALLLAVSITAMGSTILEAERSKMTGEADTRGRYARAQSAYETANTELKRLVASNVRAVEQVNAEIDAVKVPAKVLEYTAGCADFEKDLAQFRGSCQTLLRLRAQLADAQRKRELDEKISKLRADVDTLKPTERASFAEAGVSEVWGWIMGIAVVFVATFGPVIFAKLEASDASPLPAEAKPKRSETDRKERRAVGSKPQLKVRADADIEPKYPNRPKGDDGTATRAGVELQQPRRPEASSHGPNRSHSLDEMRTDLLLRNATGRAFGSQKEAAEHYGYSESRYSELSKRWESEGLIPKRRTVGRSKQLAPAG